MYRSRQSMGPFFGFLVCLYFVFHLIQGDRGVLAYLRLNQEVSKAQAINVSLNTEKQKLEKRISLLNPQHLDPDMLDERARDMLGFAGENEVVILLPPQSPQKSQQ